MQDIVEIDDGIENTFDDQADDHTDDQNDAVEDDSVSHDTSEPEAKGEYGKKVQKRIDRLVAERNIERQQREELEAALELERQRRTELEERHSKVSNEQLSAEIAHRKAKKSEYLEIGEYDKASDIDDEILELRLKQRDSQNRPEQRSTQQQPTQQNTQAASIPEAQQKWLDGNDWFYNPAKSELKNKADKTYLAMIDEGYDPNDEDTYVELDKRLSAKRQAPPPGPGPDRGNAIGDSKSVKFTSSDSAKMRQWGLNPNDPVARKEYLLNKKA